MTQARLCTTINFRRESVGIISTGKPMDHTKQKDAVSPSGSTACHVIASIHIHGLSAF
ncbi:hypothetical protein JOD02_001491 [Caldicoprobacter guelmensis]|uniref:hypothetical protein n=1 Tax=Caldicoprobacter guelmensis TaxID=1170224 RepID=UPI00195B0DF6|nr:hypothetical protein [Caldicoprobacter guelmensis]MBM7582634.1 hypothetical protein [Caldicoprobacter guelmensis]